MYHYVIFLPVFVIWIFAILQVIKFYYLKLLMLKITNKAYDSGFIKGKSKSRSCTRHSLATGRLTSPGNWTPVCCLEGANETMTTPPRWQIHFLLSINWPNSPDSSTTKKILPPNLTPVTKQPDKERPNRLVYHSSLCPKSTKFEGRSSFLRLTLLYHMETFCFEHL